MKSPSVLLTGLLLTAVLSGCISDSDTDSVDGGASLGASFSATVGEPSYESIVPDAPTGLEYEASLRQANGDLLPSAGGVIAWGDYLFSSGLGGGWYIADISDPTSPRLVFHDADEVTPYSRDVDLVFHPDGRVTAALATQGYGMHFWDVTDPENPTWLSWADVNLNHNLAVIPGTEYVINSNHRAHLDNEARNEIVDARDPSNPVVVGDFGNYGCHHQFFWTDPDTGSLSLGVCAGIEATELWDMSGFDPAAEDFGIVVLSTVEGGSLDSPVAGNIVFSRSPVFEWHHSAFISPDGQTMIIGSETNGASSPGGCIVYDENTGTSTFLGALWFYDISDRSAPSLTDWVSPSSPDYPAEPAILEGYEPDEYVKGSHDGCNSHFGDFVEGHSMMVVGWMTAGTVLIDFTDNTDVRILESHRNRKPDYGDAQMSWDAFEHGGYIFTGDIHRGMDVLRLV